MEPFNNDIMMMVLTSQVMKAWAAEVAGSDDKGRERREVHAKGANKTAKMARSTILMFADAMISCGTRIKSLCGPADIDSRSGHKTAA